MPENQKPVRSIVILANPTMPEALDEGRKVQQAFDATGIVKTALAEIDDVATHQRLSLIHI